MEDAQEVVLMRNKHKYSVWQPGKKLLGGFDKYQDALECQQKAIAMGATDTKIYDLDLIEVKEKPKD